MLIVAALASAPTIVALEALKPVAVKILYSGAFTASPGFLRWTLLGDFLKVSAWVLATPMLATRDLGVFLAFDLATHALFLISAMLLALIVEPAEGAAIGFLVSYAAYFAMCYARARARYGFRFGAAGLLAWLGGLVFITGAASQYWSDARADLPKAVVWPLLAAAFSSAFALYIRRREA